MPEPARSTSRANACPDSARARSVPLSRPESEIHLFFQFWDALSFWGVTPDLPRRKTIEPDRGCKVVFEADRVSLPAPSKRNSKRAGWDPGHNATQNPK